MKCPNCGSENCQFITYSQTNTKFLNSKNACCGSICMGPIGLLFGLIGSGSTTTTHEYWICHDCGLKFSSQAARENIKRLEDEKKSRTEFTFFKELPSYDTKLELELWKTFEEYYQEKIVGSIFESDVVVYNPSVLNEKLEQLKHESASVLGETAEILFAITDNNSFCATADAIVWKGHAERYHDIKQINYYKKSIYINQNCIQLSSEDGGKIFYELLCVLLPDKQGASYEKYEDLLQTLQRIASPASQEDVGDFLQKMQNGSVPVSENRQQIHYSSQQEYADYIKMMLEQHMAKFREMEPLKYAEYEKVHNEKEEKEKSMIKACVAGDFILLLLSWFTGGGIVATIFILVLGVIAVFAAVGIATSNSWNSYKEEYLPREIYVLLQEDERTNLEKIGNVLPLSCKKYLEATPVISQKQMERFCPHCGRKLEEGWEFCPFCNK